ncbi:diacylglycerol kinase accessory domain-domain-containing protein [Syncephalastrum racemosum]|uniref:Diacylglycerol kinase accessory domain-domain-containing protein n=1 Tax=Syncephalastrum racemosum TaxID=13706 RepID=A0A1X2HE19_SYNRA|nr:diacylglycerol kinase accessory domain-domain-containing protein [Syncephalastrum racemosum]
MGTSVRLQDTETEGRPSIYLFIFVNPLSGDRKGSDLIHLPIQHFRLRRLPLVQVEIHNILDEQDRAAGMERIQLIESMIKGGKVAPLPQEENTPDLNPQPGQSPSGGPAVSWRIKPSVRTRQMHVWSAGGDGTVMSVFELLVEHNVDLDYVYFSCNQVLGWGRAHGNVLGPRLEHLEELVTERFERADAARLDVWQVRLTADRVHKAGHANKSQSQLEVKMCNYLSLGVQGSVGSGFEKHRAGRRIKNILVYFIESCKWVFWRHFPDVAKGLHGIEQDGQTLVSFDKSETDQPVFVGSAIDMVIQNIPHIWGREVDLWGEAREGLEVVQYRQGPTDPSQWTPQRANDRKLEVFAIENMKSYLKKLANFRNHVARIGQFSSPFSLVFKKQKKRKNTYIMCDGEFYVLRGAQKLEFELYAQIWTLGRNDEEQQARLTADEEQAPDSSY